MSIAEAERLKYEWTDRYVTVMGGVPELRRFAGLTGQVKTVNMNGRALVQFDSPEDISWYDIDPYYLQGTVAPTAEKEKSAEPASAATSSSDKPSSSTTKPSEKKSAGMSPLELARQQGAAGSGSVEKPAAAKPETSNANTDQKLSPLELARKQGAAGSGKPTDAPPSKPSATGKTLSPLELARQQGAAGSSAGDTSDDGTVDEDTADADAADSAGTKPSSTTDKTESPKQRNYSTTTFADEVLARRKEATTSDDDAAPSEPDTAKTPSPDDLKVIEGIGPRIEQLLKEAGITTWAELSQAKPDDIREILTAAGSRYQMHDPTTWPDQARLAVEGDWKELAELQDRLDGGRP